MTTIKIFGEHDARTKQLIDNVALALTTFPLDSKVVEVSEPNSIHENGVASTPALMLDGVLVCEGTVPSAQEITNYFHNRFLFQSKLYRLRKLSVPVDLSEAAENALLYAWSLARELDAEIEVLYVMDSIFEGERPSSSGFLSGYKKTMQAELDQFVQKALSRAGVVYTPIHQQAAAPNENDSRPHVSAHVIYGFPDTALIEHSKQCDLVIMGTTGRGTVGRKLFGSISIEVSKSGHAPVLLVPPNSTFTGYKNILYASNFDSLDALRIKQAVAFAQRFKSQLHFVHVGKPGEKGVDLERKLFEINYRYSNADFPFHFTNMVGDDVVEQLYEYTQTHKVDVLAFVTHQRSFWDNILHHSITRDVLFDTFTPVLVMHADNDMITK